MPSCDRLLITRTSSRRGTYCYFKRRTVRWDNLEAQVKKEEKDEKIDGDAALNKFFRDIYQDADEDTRRAMRKSFVESNGTVLFHKWREVGSKKRSPRPLFRPVLRRLLLFDQLPRIRRNAILWRVRNQPVAPSPNGIWKQCPYDPKWIPLVWRKEILGCLSYLDKGVHFTASIILVTHPRTGDLRESLKYIYNLYVEYVAKNPLYTPGTPISCELFNSTLDQYVRGLG
ncbi:hypothetical protein F0562_031181 [Nyssa sinensis]|uniref:Trafficking protein particle complex subunit n=1 Tax=Nyssa sinensis TaxID=561372 RepID=A0A5J5ATT0_9ASTE|nr:hypothetical protein F0562_031181 [Nyssa sinensis]